MKEAIRVLLVDDHQMVRMGLSALLSMQPDIRVVGEASTGMEALEKLQELTPEVVLMDLVMAPMDGIETIKRMMAAPLKKVCDAKIIVLTSFVDDAKVVAALEAGAFSYLLKTSSGDQVVEAIRKAARNESVLENEVAKILIKQVHKKPEKHQLLTQRELEVLRLIGEGKSNKEICELLFIGIKTVKTHVSNILAKLEVEDRTKAAVYANQHGLTEIF